jgi:hypothetical protein
MSKFERVWWNQWAVLENLIDMDLLMSNFFTFAPGKP